MNRWLIIVAGLGLAGLTVAADPPKPAAVIPEADRGEGVSLTVYNHYFVVVKERPPLRARGRGAVSTAH
jgi:hypothetical protein